MSTDDSNIDCPLCLEPLEMDDVSFFPCTCGYQICRFCWHRIRTDENGLCPACRKQYPEDPADFKPLTQEQLHRIKNEKRQRDIQRKQKISENRKHLANVRVVQKNLVFVVGLSQRLADPEVLKKNEYFGKFGKVHKVVINHTTSYAGSQGPSASAYVTYHRSEDSLRAIQVVNNIVVDNRTLKASLGTTKYCSHFLKNQPCPKADCMYLHELGDQAASFTKEEMQQGKHQEYEKKLHDTLLSSTEKSKESRKQSSSPTSGQQQPSSTSPVSMKESWPSLQNNDSCGGGSKSEQKPNSWSSKTPISNCNKENVENQRNRNASEEDTSANRNPRNRDRTSESSQSSSASPVQENVNVESWSTNSSPSSESSDTDSNGLNGKPVLDSPRLPMESSHENKVYKPNGYIPTIRESMMKSSLHSNIPPRFQNHVPVQHKQIQQQHLSQTSYPPGLMKDVSKLNGLSSLNHSSAVNKALLDNTNPNHSFFSTVNGLRNPAAPQPIPVSGSDWPINGFERTQLTTTDTLPVSTTTDWQAAFGFGPSQKHSTADDDLGFDPWNESTKGLADLIAKESRINGDKNEAVKNNISPPGCRKVCVPPPGFSLNHVNNFSVNSGVKPQHNGDSSEHVTKMVMNQRMMQNDRNSLYNVDSMHNSELLHKQQEIHDTSTDRFRNWQAELRAMLPNINISFGSHPNYSSSHNAVGSHTHQSDVFKDTTDCQSQHWNYKSIHNPAAEDMSNMSNGSGIHHRLSLTSAQQYALRMNSRSQYQWDNTSSFSQMPPGFSQHLSAKHHTEQQILGNLPSVL